MPAGICGCSACSSSRLSSRGNIFGAGGVILRSASKEAWMSRRLGLAIAAALVLVLVPSAVAAAPSFMAVQGGNGVSSRDGTMLYLALNAAGNTTTLQVQRASDRGVVKSRSIDGAFGVPMLADSYTDAIFRDGSAFVVQNLDYGKRSELRIVNTSDLSVRDSISFAGTYSYDALSPDGKVMYLIQHTSADDVTHYVVRAYDLDSHTLRPGRIADKSQRGWVMQGFPAKRTATKDGRWVYTMYANPNGYPFIHALDTVNGVAHCVGFATPPGGDGQVFNGKLVLKGSKLQVRAQGGSLWRVIDLRNWRVTKR